MEERVTADGSSATPDARRYWCAWALTGEGTANARPGVLVEVDGGRIAAVRSAAEPPPDAERLPGLTMPGMANAHSHAFHRALRGRTGERGGSFWTWRERMYQVADRLDPDSYHRLARGVYAEMALAGITCVGEFHYLHHGPGGVRYRDRNAMSAALVAAAADAGVRITLLDTCYLSGGLTEDGRRLPLTGPQLRFGDGDVEAWAGRVADFRPHGDHARVGAAVHSVRAVPADAIRHIADAARPNERAVHAHLSEQPAENSACLAAHGRTPTELLADTGFLERTRPTLVHATHLTARDAALISGVAARVCLCPTTERDLADGCPPLDLLADVPLVLGSDGHSTIDMFEEARGVEAHERLRTGRRGHVPAERLLDALHRPGHTALGWPDAGSITPGARADLVNIDLDGVRLAGLDPHRAADGLVAAGAAAAVRHVMADGRWIVRDGRHRTVPDAASRLDAEIRALTST
ncbi:formimidoylglutamate deiminase [Marinactinospora rubrisoli]|uniref:Formimidoylglutamate deiminase n=1 Tax=Marinactinospora rubrisoli TaxID=2715399 RepID=A0ABW2KM94_9ACTN